MNRSTDQKRIVKWRKNNQQNQMDEKVWRGGVKEYNFQEIRQNLGIRSKDQGVIEILMITNSNQVYFAEVLDCGFQEVMEE